MLTRLSTFLRFYLDNDPEKKVRLYDELKALMLYLEIEKTRFDHRLSIKFHVEAKAGFLLVPSLLLQALVENSIKFAIAQMSSGGVIEISAKCINNLLHLEVADNGPDGNSSKVASPEHSLYSEYKGVGIQNIIDRLNVLYPGNHDFSISRNLPRGYKANITIPMEEM